MIKCSVFIATSLDGFIARKNGEIDWLSRPEYEIAGEDFGYHAFFNRVDALVMGRNTYELARSFVTWPYAGKRVVVLTNRDIEIPESLSCEVQVMTGNPEDIVATLHSAGMRELYIDGGNTIQRFLRAGKIDEMTITRIPVVLGEGISLFGETDKDILLTHAQTNVYSNGFVQSTYKVSSP